MTRWRLRLEISEPIDDDRIREVRHQLLDLLADAGWIAKSTTSEWTCRSRNCSASDVKDENLRTGEGHHHVDLDVSKIAPTREEALQLAREHGQVSIFGRAAGARGDWEQAGHRSS